jgi:hypothetical protein
MFNLTIEHEARKGAGLGRGRPKVYYCFDGIRLTGNEWAAHLDITVIHFYRRVKRHRKEPESFPAWQIFTEHFGKETLDTLE